MITDGRRCFHANDYICLSEFLPVADRLAYLAQGCVAMERSTQAAKAQYDAARHRLNEVEAALVVLGEALVGLDRVVIAAEGIKE